VVACYCATCCCTAGSSVAFTYDFDNLLTGAGALTITRQPATGLIAGTTLSGVSESRTLNGYGEVTARAFTRSGSTLYSASYTRDALARIESKTETVAGTSHTEAYTYDAAGRLETVTRDGVLSATYGYDPNGNRTSTTSGGAVSASYDGQDRLQQWGTTTYTYAAAGELLTRTEPGAGTTTYAYDVQGNLRQVALPTGTVIQYQVDALNRRIGRLVNGVRTHGWLWAGTLRPVAELDGAGNVVSRFVYGTGINVPDYLVRAGQTYRLITDHLGSVRLVVNVASGAVAQQVDYDAWGKVTLDTNPGWQPFGFAGGIYDAVTGMVRLGARDLDTSTGRWLAREPLAFPWGTTNDFAYVSGDPINRIDPTGEDWLSAASNFAQGVVTGVVGGAVVTAGVASGTVLGAAAAVGAVGYGSYQGTIALQELILGFDPYTGRPLTTEERIDVGAGLAGGAVGGGAAGGRLGRTGEFVIGSRCRIAPFGNRGNHPQGRYPHYHRSVPDPARPGESVPGQGIGRHRPWQTKSTDTSIWDRF
jgi:RHS repeat-associated protein